MSEELKPCPFCGGAAETGFEDNHTGAHVKCSQCGVVGPVWSNDTNEAIYGWNTRSANRESFDAGWEYHKLLDPSQARLSEAVKVLEPLVDAWSNETTVSLAQFLAAKQFLATLGEEFDG